MNICNIKKYIYNFKNKTLLETSINLVKFINLDKNFPFRSIENSEIACYPPHY